ncbi:UNKNOWN [Stylonychia lemnae]|uniref:Uncharacterized protein n=1 Tax=Stylonychia lemnae TaxID=5949 RepID=A0A078AWG7_STYLE|nr:UNKNOWN [Stylonychia lemnae]|eukprot:CDW86386.1 UNKNOWN [Stylonychia lemnae]
MDLQQKDKFEKEFYFTKLELTNNDFVYAFAEFEDHPVGIKQDFNVGNLTIFKSNLSQTPIFTAQRINSFFIKIYSLINVLKLKDVKFSFKDPHQLHRPGEIDYILNDEQPKFRIYFKVQQQADVVAFEVSNIKSTVVPNPMHYFADKMSEFVRRKNREIDDLKKERDTERQTKLDCMKEINKLIKQSEEKEQVVMQKFCLILNEKKLKIAELKELLKAIQEDEINQKNRLQNKEPPQIEMRDIYDNDEYVDQLKNGLNYNNQNKPSPNGRQGYQKSQYQERSKEQINQDVRQNTLQYLQSQSQMTQSQRQQQINSLMGTTLQLDTQHLRALGHSSESIESDFDKPDSRLKSQQQKNKDRELLEKQNSLTDLFFN